MEFLTENIHFSRTCLKTYVGRGQLDSDFHHSAWWLKLSIQSADFELGSSYP